MTSRPSRRRPGRTIAILRGVWRILARAASADGAIDEDAGETFDDVLARAHARSGWTGLLREGGLECANLMAELVHVGRRRSRISDGRPRSTRAVSKGITTMMTRFARDLRLAWRHLRARPGAPLIAAATLGLGIGISTAVFSILDSILWHPVPYRDAARLVELDRFDADRRLSYSGDFPPALVAAWRRATDLFDRVEAYDTPSLVYADDRSSEMVSGATVTPGLLSMLGAVPELGREFVSGDGQNAAFRIALVSDRFWRTQLQGDPAVLDRSVRLDDVAYRVVGVMPATFRFPSDRVDVWTAVDVDRPPPGLPLPAMTPVAHLVAGLAIARADEQVRLRGGRLNASIGGPATLSASASSLDRYVDDKTRASLDVLAGAVAFLLLVVVANVAGLALTQSLGRAHDLAVRSALGATRGDLIRETLFDNGLVAGAGVVIGVALASVLVSAAVAALPDAVTGSTFTEIAINGRALLWAIGVSALSAIGFGVPAAVIGSSQAMARVLVANSRSVTGSVVARRLRHLLVIVEVTLSIVLLAGTALMARSFIKLESAGRGYDTSNLVSMRLALPASGYENPAVRDQLARDVAARVRAIPGAIGVTVGSLPVSSETGSILVGPVEAADRPGARTAREIVLIHEVAADYFSTLRLRVDDGRVFAAGDPLETVVISQRFAHAHWPEGHAVGKRFRVGTGSWRTVIGVVDDTRDLAADLGHERAALYCQPGGAQEALVAVRRTPSVSDYRVILIRADRPAAVVPRLAAAVHDVDPRVVVWRTSLVEHLYADAIARPRVVLLMMTVLGGVGLLLAAAGLYAVLSHLVSQRLREIGIRLALGATPAAMGGLVLQSGIVLTCIGLAAGLTLALALTRVMRTLLYEVGPSDPFSMALVAVLLAVVALLATWWPARRAMRADPVRLLRDE